MLDPQVLCYFLTHNFLATLGRIFDPVFWAEDILYGPGLRLESWWIALWPSYLDADRDGRGSFKEFYDVKVTQVLKIIFDGLDVNSDGLVKQNEARLKSLFRPSFLRSLAQELFDYLDRNNDEQMSVTDIPQCGYGTEETPLCLYMKPLENRTMENCHLLVSPLDLACTSLTTTYLSPDFDE